VHVFHQYFCAKKLQSQNVTREKLREALSYEKLSCKMLMKLTPEACVACISSSIRRYFSVADCCFLFDNSDDVTGDKLDGALDTLCGSVTNSKKVSKLLTGKYCLSLFK